MPTFKTLRFDMLTLNAEFTVQDPDVQAKLFGVVGEKAGAIPLVKKATLSARRTDLPGGADASRAIAMSGAMKVVVTIPDPTPEEIAAKEAEMKENLIKWSRRGLVHGIEQCETKLARFAERLANNPHDAFSWGQDAAEASGKLFAYKRLLAMFDDKGMDETIAAATREVLSGARNPQHSTAQLSNIVAEAVTAGYAEFASRSLF